MADVDTNLYQWSTTEASNKPTGATTIATNLDDNLRRIQATTRAWLAHKGADIASAATTDLGAVEGLLHDVTGTTSITSFGTVSAGIWKAVKFEGALTLTHNATSLILPGAANITTANGDVAIMMSEGSGNWRCLAYMKADGSHLGPVLGTEQASTSGTSLDFSIPSWAKKITIQFVGVSTSGTDAWLVQLADSGGVEDTGYLGSCARLTDSAAVSVGAFTAGFGISSSSASNVIHGTVVLTLEDAANFTWVASGNLADSAAGLIFTTAGSKSLSAALSSVRITTSSGTDTFDAGAVNVVYE
jgi:uncharacterized cupin superfamily protein